MPPEQSGQFPREQAQPATDASTSSFPPSKKVPALNTPISPNDQQYQNWRGRPLTSRLAVIELIAATTTTTGLTVECELNTNTYQKGIKVTAAEMATLNI